LRLFLAQRFALALCLALLVSGAEAKTKPKSIKSSPCSAKTSTRKGKVTCRAAKKNWRSRGQQAMDKERVREIQAALVRENYLQGQPTGIWDQRSKDAMAKYQAANGWQSKVVPDSRALIKLGLGPDHADLINPQTAATGIIPGGGTVRNASATSTER